MKKQSERFMLGCNYWASHAGTDMWRNWDEEVVDNDIKVLSQFGIKYMRVFPLWRDFQPAEPYYRVYGSLYEHRLQKDRKSDNEYFIDTIMIERFEKLCRIAQKYNVQLIVGLITGWMSGRLFVPPALYNKNIITDPVSTMLQQKFVKGFVTKLKNEESIYAWDLGNECNCLESGISREQAYTWSAMITNAIKAADNTRDIISGMHGLSCDGAWRIKDQGEIVDVLTTHPYPYWVPHCRMDRINSIRTLLHATAQTKFYADIGKKPCFAEEIGTMGPMVCSDNIAADFMRVNLFSNWANDSKGVMWWCANEQSHLDNPPFDWLMCERELGMLNSDMTPKPVLQEFKKFNDWLKNADISLQSAEIDAVCILTRNIDQWAIAYSSYILAKQAGLNISFCFADDDLPKSNAYLLPSINGDEVMNKSRYYQLKQYVAEGATVYISNQEGVLTEFRDFSGIIIDTTEQVTETQKMQLENYSLSFSRNKRCNLILDTAEVIAYDQDNNPCLCLNHYGKGKVYYLNFPLEKNLIDSHNAYINNHYLVYRKAFENILKEHIIQCQDTNISITTHPKENGYYCVAINYSDKPILPKFILNGCKIDEIYYGDITQIGECNALIFSLKTYDI